ncbi:hypothetical protein ACFHW2_29395 [Actinomadura sp. LOL_016]|uniref:hypothetical protein n=1 Tax=unclassified Actinomadura TaxID=2626254 RepID=UPI003A80C796
MLSTGSAAPLTGAGLVVVAVDMCWKGAACSATAVARMPRSPPVRTPPSARTTTSGSRSASNRALPVDEPGIATGPTLLSEPRMLAVSTAHPLPDVVYIPFSDAPPLRWSLYWRTDGATASVRAFVRAACDLTGTDH